MRAFTNLATFRNEALFSNWLSRIALNEALGRVRQRRPTAELSELETNGIGARLIMFPASQLFANPETETTRADPATARAGGGSSARHLQNRLHPARC